MRSAATRTPLLTALAVGVIAVAAWWFASSGETPRVEAPPASDARDGAASGADSSAAASEAALPAGVVAAERQLDLGPSRASTRAQLRGFVVDRAGARVNGAQLRWGETTTELEAASFGSTRRLTAPAGEYAIPGLPAAVVRFEVSAKGCQPLALALDLAKGGALRHDFVVDRSSLVTVHVRTPQGAPLDAAMVRGPFLDLFDRLSVVATKAPLTTIEPSEFSTRHLALGVGTFHRAGPGRRRRENTVEVPPGAFGVLELPHLPLEATLVLEHVVIDRHTIGENTVGITFTLDPERIDRWTSGLRVKVVDAATGEPVVGATVGVADLLRMGSGLSVPQDGTFQETRLAPGWKTIEITAPDRPRWSRSRILEPGHILDLGTVALPRGITLRGTIVDTDGAPARASFVALASDGYVPGAPFFTLFEWETNEPGEWRIAPLAPGRHQLSALGHDARRSEMRAWLVVDVAESMAPLALTLRSTVEVAIDGGCETLPEGTPVGAQHRIDLVRADGFVVTAAEPIAGLHRVGLLPGSYSCSIRVGTTLRRTVGFDVGEQSLRVRFSLDGDDPPEVAPLAPREPGDAPAEDAVVAVMPTAATDEPPGLSIAGRLVDPADAAVDGARLSARDAQGRYFAAVIAADGSFVVAGLRAGLHELVASADGCRPARAEVELADGREPDETTLVLRRMTRLSVAFVDPQGQPLEALYEERFRGGQLERDLSVVATRAPPPSSWPRSSPGLGSWEPKSGTSGGTLELRELPPLHAAVVHGGSVVATQPIEPGATALRFAIDLALLDAQLATLRFRLVDGLTRQPIPRAFAGLDGRRLVDASNGQERPDGIHQFDRLAPGRRRLHVSTIGGEAARLVIDLPAGGTLDLGDVELLEPVELHGVVVTEAGLPVSTAVRVIDHDAAGEPQLDGYYEVVDSDAAGRFTVRTSRPLVRFQCDALPAYATAPLVVDVAATTAAKSELRLVLRRGQTVIFRPPADDDLRRIALRAAEGVLLRAFVLDGPSTFRVGLLPGDYRLVVERDGADAKEIAFSVGDGPVTIDLP